MRGAGGARSFRQHVGVVRTFEIELRDFLHRELNVFGRHSLPTRSVMKMPSSLRAASSEQRARDALLRVMASVLCRESERFILDGDGSDVVRRS